MEPIAQIRETEGALEEGLHYEGAGAHRDAGSSRFKGEHEDSREELLTEPLEPKRRVEGLMARSTIDRCDS
jgi:hypothetical protein